MVNMIRSPRSDEYEPMNDPYYRSPLALIHHLAYGGHADRIAPGVLMLLAPVLRRDGLVVELGCGSGALTRHLVEAGHRVLATDASPAFVELGAKMVPGARFELLSLPDDPIPEADAIVAVGHVFNYLPDHPTVDQALVAVAGALRPGGVMVVDLLTAFGVPEPGEPSTQARVEDEWAMMVTVSRTAPDRLVRQITTFVESEGRWERDDEIHENLLTDPGRLPGLFDPDAYRVTISKDLGGSPLPEGMVGLVVVRANTTGG
jgi:SAM-dependent methyltransferase